MKETKDQLRSTIWTLRGEVRGQARRIAYLERQLQDPRAHEKHVAEVYEAIAKAWRCLMNTDENWRHEANGDDCMGHLARLIPERYWGYGMKPKAESIKWPLMGYLPVVPPTRPEGP